MTAVGGAFPFLSPPDTQGPCSQDAVAHTGGLKSAELLPPSRHLRGVFPVFPLFAQITLDCRTHTEEGSTGSHLRSGPFGSELCPWPLSFCGSEDPGAASREDSGVDEMSLL